MHVSQFTQGTPAHTHVASHRHEYDYKGVEQVLLHSSIVSRILSLTYYTLLLVVNMHNQCCSWNQSEEGSMCIENMH